MEKQFNSLKNKKVHFVGVKGAGMSSLAKIFLGQGAVVFGSDAEEEFFTDEILKKLGVKVRKFNAKNIAKNLDLVVYSTAYQSSHPELKKARELKIPLVSYNQALGFLFNDKIGIAVCGTHGKTTSAGMLGKIFKDAGLAPTVLVGGEVLNWKTGALCGRGKYFISEADEYQEKFLTLKPKAVLITNIEYDHPDYFKNFSQYKNVFKKFIQRIEPAGICIGFEEDKAVREVLKNSKVKKIFFSQKKQKKIFGKIKLKIPGQHNKLNALGVFLAARH
ncbi:MAG: Mur ligase domain-containing protein, partial [Patescibacteria group bacterium]